MELVLFEAQIFAGAEADVVLLLADGYGQGSASHATIVQVEDADALDHPDRSVRWAPEDPAAKWTGLLLPAAASTALDHLRRSETFGGLRRWGETTLGMVTGSNRYFTMAPDRARELGLGGDELLAVSPPGSSHLRGLELTASDLASLGQGGRATLLFRPGAEPSPAAEAYIKVGHLAGVDAAYKCRIRSPWYQVPLVPVPDLFLTCMNADTPRLCSNLARVRHLNSVHGLYLRDQVRAIGRDLLALASLNSASLLDAELVGRSYGGGILKLEPREADIWTVPSPDYVRHRSRDLRGIKTSVAGLLSQGELLAAVQMVDDVLFGQDGPWSRSQLEVVRSSRQQMFGRRMSRGRSAR